jgi:hypothetical protein
LYCLSFHCIACPSIVLPVLPLSLQWKDRQYNGRTDNTIEGQVIQWKDRQYNGRTRNTMEGQAIQWQDR